ncbi:MAG: DUF4857 domain-containing protein [Rikenellaceae bacterium]
MKKTNRLLLIITLLATFAVMLALPPLVRKATVSNDNYPFVYYSSQLNELCLIDYSNKETPMEDLSGRKYTTKEFDSLIPLLNYRQLMKDGLLPDSICGVSAEPRNLMINSVVIRYNPVDKDRPKVGLYSLLESMPTRVGLTTPPDLFRIADRIEFLDAESNSINYEKSDRFQQELLKRGYEFPTQWAVGDANTRKPYDEGYFCLDAKGDLYHLKMVNGRPFVKNTKISESIDIAYFATYNPASKRFYGYMISDQGEFYLLASDDMGGYTPMKLDIGTIDMERDRVLLMGNILYWTLSISNSEGRQYVALNADDLQQVATHYIAKELNAWDYVSIYLMPFTLTFEADNSEMVYPRFTFAGVNSFFVSILLALLSLLYIFRGEPLAIRLYSFALVAVSGIAGLIALIILPKFKK